jgi:hypothetical protein
MSEIADRPEVADREIILRTVVLGIYVDEAKNVAPNIMQIMNAFGLSDDDCALKVSLKFATRRGYKVIDNAIAKLNEEGVNVSEWDAYSEELY